MRVADERAAGIAMSPGAAQPHIHEAVSDIAITRMNSALTSFPTSMPQSASQRRIIPPSPESYAGGAMSGSLLPSTPPRQNKRAGLFVAVGAVTALSLAGTFMFLRTTMVPHAATGNAAGNVAPTPPSPPAPTTPVVAQTVAAPQPTAPPMDTAGGTVLDINDLPSADAKPEGTTKPTDKPASAPKGTGPTKATATATTKPAPTSKTWVPQVQDPGF